MAERVCVWIAKSRELEKTSQDLPVTWSWPQKSHEINENVPFSSKSLFLYGDSLAFR